MKKCIGENRLLEILENIKSVITNKVDKVNGKSLSANDFTDNDKNKLEYTNVAYCTCSTAANVSAKVATIDGNLNFVLQKGAIAIVKFTVSNTASNCTLNVGDTGAKSIWFSAAKFTGNSTQVCGYANRTLVYVYDGTYWVWACGGYDATIYTTSMCSTAPATAAKVATCTNYVALAKSYTIVATLYSNSYAGAITLNINGQGAKPIYINGTASSTTNYSLPAGHYLVYYDGTNYYFRTDGKITGCVSEDGGTINGKIIFGKKYGIDGVGLYVSEFGDGSIGTKNECFGQAFVEAIHCESIYFSSDNEDYYSSDSFGQLYANPLGVDRRWYLPDNSGTILLDKDLEVSITNITPTEASSGTIKLIAYGKLRILIFNSVISAKPNDLAQLCIIEDPIYETRSTLSSHSYNTISVAAIGNGGIVTIYAPDTHDYGGQLIYMVK